MYLIQRDYVNLVSATATDSALRSSSLFCLTDEAVFICESRKDGQQQQKLNCKEIQGGPRRQENAILGR